MTSNFFSIRSPFRVHGIMAHLKSKCSSRDQGDLSQPTPDCFTPACGVCSGAAGAVDEGLAGLHALENALEISFALWPKK